METVTGQGVGLAVLHLEQEVRDPSDGGPVPRKVEDFAEGKDTKKGNAHALVLVDYYERLWRDCAGLGDTSMCVHTHISVRTDRF